MDNLSGLVTVIAVAVALFLLGIILLPRLPWFQKGGKIDRIKRKVEELQDKDVALEAELEFRKMELELKQTIATRKKNISLVSEKIKTQEEEDMQALSGS